MTLDGLAGRVRLQPGVSGAGITSSRPRLAAQLARGRRADELPALLGSLFSLCSHAQRATARRAVAAALGREAVCDADEHRALRAATAREQVLRIALDWPRLLPGPRVVDPAALLQDCPLLRPELDETQRLAALPGWLAERWLARPVADWLQRHEADPHTWAHRWCEDTDVAPARLLRAHAAPLQHLLTPSRPLHLLAQPLATLPRLARRIAEEPDFCAAPDWLGEPAETGPWTRIKDGAPRPLHNAWMRLIARLVDLLRLAAPDGDERLAAGALPLPGGEAIAWTEMARGLLVHWVRLEDRPDGPRVADCRVLAPTDWNFHSRGVLARTLASLCGDDRFEQAARAAVAFDPCVEFELVGASALEAAHA